MKINQNTYMESTLKLLSLASFSASRCSSFSLVKSRFMSWSSTVCSVSSAPSSDLICTEIPDESLNHGHFWTKESASAEVSNVTNANPLQIGTSPSRAFACFGNSTN